MNPITLYFGTYIFISKHPRPRSIYDMKWIILHLDLTGDQTLGNRKRQTHYRESSSRDRREFSLDFGQKVQGLHWPLMSKSDRNCPFNYHPSVEVINHQNKFCV